MVIVLPLFLPNNSQNPKPTNNTPPMDIEPINGKLIPVEAIPRALVNIPPTFPPCDVELISLVPLILSRLNRLLRVSVRKVYLSKS